MNGWFVARTSQSSLPSVSFATEATVTERRGADDAGTSSASSIVDVKGAEARANARGEALRDGQIAERVRAMMVFDRNLVKAHRDRAAFLQERALKTRPEQPPDALLDELARRLLDRLRDIKRDFKRVVVLGGACEAITRRLLAEREDVETIVVVDLSKDMLDFCALTPESSHNEKFQKDAVYNNCIVVPLGTIPSKTDRHCAVVLAKERISS